LKNVLPIRLDHGLPPVAVREVGPHPQFARLRIEILPIRGRWEITRAGRGDTATTVVEGGIVDAWPCLIRSVNATVLSAAIRASFLVKNAGDLVVIGVGNSGRLLGLFSLWAVKPD